MNPGDVFFVVFLGSVVSGFGLLFTYDTKRLFWNPRRKYGPQAKALRRAKHSVEDLVHTKDRIRHEERQKWGEQFTALAGHDWFMAGALPASEPAVDIDGQEIPVAERPTRRQPKSDPSWLPEFEGTIIAVDGQVIRGVTRPTRTPQVIAVHGKQAHLVLQGRYAGHYAIHERAGDLLLDGDNFTILESYSDGHYSTCPYECDCPKWARKAP